MPKARDLNIKPTRPNYARALLSLWQATELDAGQQLDVYTRILSVAQQLLGVDNASIWWQQSGDEGNQLVCMCASDPLLRQKAIPLTLLPNYWHYLQQQSLMVCDHANQKLPQQAVIMTELLPFLAGYQSI
ncbi:MAG: hypothetical protein M1572_02210, partial [Gammaproteobacteria bacterium]|nr:hypothetical protein [Gammaproteobacteria bacterium]